MSGELFVDRYEILETLGEGGFATVSRARDTRDGTTVAIKVLRQDDGTYPTQIVQRFQREVEIIAQLNHPNTVRLLDYGEAPDGTLYMVSEYLHGEDLYDLMRRLRKVDPEVTFHIISQLLGSLAEAHRLGLLHRDIKPQNIRIIREDGDPYVAKLLDFGIARRMFRAADDMITSDGALVGTPRYMSPEQLTERALSPASDIYSLGLVAVEMLFGEEVLQGSSLQAQFDRLLTPTLLDDATVYALLGPHLGGILQRMTAIDLTVRFPTADAVLTALRNPTLPTFANPTFQAPPPAARTTSSDRPPPTVVERRPERARPLPIMAVAAVIGLIVIAVVVVASLSGPEPTAQTTNVTDVSALTRAVTPQPTTVEAVKEEPEEVEGPPTPCEMEPPFTGRGRLTVEGMLTSRQLPMFIPESYGKDGKPAPLIVLLHSDLIEGEAFLDYTKFDSAAKDHDFVVVVPPAPDAGNAWHERPELLKDVVEPVLDNLCIDREQIFLAGHAGGGAFAFHLACEPWVAGVAASNHRTVDATDCETPRPMMLISPADSQRFPLDGKPRCRELLRPDDITPYDTQLEALRAKNACAERPKRWHQFESGKCEQHSCSSPLVTCLADGGFGWGQADRRALTGILTLRQCQESAADFPTTDAILTFFEEVRAAKSAKIVDP